MPLPDRDFDLTEVVVPWKLAVEAGHRVLFATESGGTPATDPLLISGVVFGQFGAEADPIALYRELERAPEFVRPLRWDQVDPDAMDALILAGGHAPGMRQYLGSARVQDQVARFFRTGRPVGAICHGPLVAARARDPDSGRSPLFGLRSACLPKYLERTAFYATAWRRGRYYRTYPAYVQDEVQAALASPSALELGPWTGLRRGSRTDDGPAFVVEDGRYVSARWPGDAWAFGRRLLAQL